MIVYEWLVEEVDAHGDIVETSGFDSAADMLAYMRAGELANGLHYEFGIVRNQRSNDDPENLEDRQWAYVTDGRLPEAFDGGARVPKKIIAEFSESA